MELLLQPAALKPSASRRPFAWLREQQLSRPFWTFFAAAFFFDAGFALYFFLFNLFLLDLGFNERSMGLIGGALTLGTLLGTLPAGPLVGRYGVRPLLFVCFTSAPLLGILRTSTSSEVLQIAFALLAGLAMCLWGVCFLPAVARLTTERNRSAGFGLIFAASLGTSTLGGILCSLLPHWLTSLGILLAPAALKRSILCASCLVALAGLLPLLRLHLPEASNINTDQDSGDSRMEAASGQPHVSLRARLQPCRTCRERIAALAAEVSLSIHEVNKLHLAPYAKLTPISLLLIALLALWAGIQSAFTPFAMVHLTRDLNLPLEHTALLFSVAQTLQLIGALATPFLFRGLGLARGVASTQVLTALCLALMALVPSTRAGVVLYLGFAAAQWMASPGMYNLLMSATPDPGRSSAAALAMFTNALAGTSATALAGSLLTRFGYPPIMLLIAAAAAAIALVTGMTQNGANVPKNAQKNAISS